MSETSLGGLASVNEDSIDHMIVLAERIRLQDGGTLDESAIQAVAEATGAPVEYVRLAAKLRTEKEKRNLLSNARAQFLTLEPDTRRYVVSGMVASACALCANVEYSMQLADGRLYGIFGMLGIVIAFVGLYNVGVSRDAKVAAFSGAIFGVVFAMMRTLFASIMGLTLRADPLTIVPMALAGAVFGVALQRLVERNRNRLGLRDPVEDRQSLLRQLHELREKLHSGEQSMAFLSVDVVGSTRMKQMADPLAVEFTFNEFHHFVERVTERYGGKIHSTAGDGVISAFDSPQQAVSAAKHMQAGLIELNTLRNKLSSPIVVRCGIHSGTIVAPTAGDVTSVNFSDVIDIAASLQKAAAPGAIAISEYAALSLPGGPRALGSENVEASGVRGVQFSTRPLRQQLGATIPPPPETTPQTQSNFG